jgi:exopolysaccharide biosynthesis protein
MTNPGSALDGPRLFHNHSLAAPLRRRFALYVVVLSFVGAPHTSGTDSAAQVSQQVGSHEFRAVGRGVEHLRIIRGNKSENEATGPWLINLLRVDPRQVSLRIAHALDEGVGLETTSSLAARYKAIAAVNAGFFRTTGTYRGEPSGVLVVDGKLISEPLEGRAAAGFIRNAIGWELILGHLKFSGHLALSRGRGLAISGLNRPRGDNELIVYTPEFHRNTLTTPDGVEVICRRNRVVRVRDGQGSLTIPADGFVLSACGSAREWVLANLRAGSMIRLDLRLTPIEIEKAEAWKRASFIVGGGPQLISKGQVAITFEEEKVTPRFVSDRHPRTAIALLKDGRALLATVDGRQPGVSAGMSLPEFAQLLLEFDVSEAINLDGGGSTTMVVKGKLVNIPSDQTGERPVSDAILLIPRRLLQNGIVH